MEPLPLSAASSEEEFADCIDALGADSSRRQQLTDLLREDHPVYDQRGGATVSLMRGWTLLSLARTPIPDDALRFVLEELDTGVDPYLVAAAARALRSYPHPGPAFAPFVMRALDHIRYHDDPVCFDAYGEYGTTSASSTSPVRELLKTAAWLGPHAGGVLPQIETLAQSRGLARRAKADAVLAAESIRSAMGEGDGAHHRCCQLRPELGGTFSWRRNNRRSVPSIQSVSFETHEGVTVTFKDVFDGHPTIVVFFYTRCDNPLKCSLTVTKLARVQKLLAERGLAERIHTAAITYDPAFDNAKRIATYGRDRGVRLDARHHMLRAPDGLSVLRAHFTLGVNFIESLVNRHRVEAYVLDEHGRIAGSFERLLWDEEAVVARATDVLIEPADENPAASARTDAGCLPSRSVSALVGVVASVAIAFFPKCPVCWATYLSMLGVVGLDRVPFPSWLQPALVVALVINLASVWWRARITGRVMGAFFVTVGAAVILASQYASGWEHSEPWRIAFVLGGSLLSAMDTQYAKHLDTKSAAGVQSV
jgi:protein SCO1/2